MKRDKEFQEKFAEDLVTIRKERGYPTAYGFFHKIGGKKYFDFDYKHYLLIENGTRLPSQNALQKIVDGLGLSNPGFASERRTLLVSFLRAITEGNPQFDVIFEKPQQKAQETSLESELLSMVAAKSMTTIPRMSVEQEEVTRSTGAAFWLLNFLVGTGIERTAEQLSELLDIPMSSVTEALDKLTACQLLEKKKNGSYVCPFFKSGIRMPLSNDFPKKALWYEEQIRKKLTKQPDPPYYSYFLTTAENEKHLTMIQELFRDAVRKANLLNIVEPAEKGTFISVECRIGKLATIK